MQDSGVYSGANIIDQNVNVNVNINVEFVKKGWRFSVRGPRVGKFRVSGFGSNRILFVLVNRICIEDEYDDEDNEDGYDLRRL